MPYFQHEKMNKPCIKFLKAKAEPSPTHPGKASVQNKPSIMHNQ